MTNLTLVASRQAVLPPAQWAHDIRNLLATIGLHLESLARLSGPQGAKAVSAANALIARAGGMCSEAVAAADGGNGRRRHPFDITAIIRQVVDLVAPLGPEGLSIDVASTGTHVVLGDHTELFRVLFNLLSNASAVARSGTKLRRIDISIERSGEITVVRIADDGGGLPPRVAAGLFRAPPRAGAMRGHGLAIARELMERNGGTLVCETSRKGTIFRLELAAFTSIRVAEGPVTRSLGQRATGYRADVIRN
jgi:C4-dicarboxylate-specific signal transduction histidine kinase